MKTIKQLRNNIGVYNKTLNNFLKTYKIKNVSLTDDYEISLELYNILISFKSKILEYESDFYQWKTINHIAIKTKIEECVVLEYLNQKGVLDKNSSSFDGELFNSKLQKNDKTETTSTIIFGEIDFDTDSNGNIYEVNKFSENQINLNKLLKEKKLFTIDTKLSHISTYDIEKNILLFAYNKGLYK